MSTDNNIIEVSTPKELPRDFIPQKSVEHARAKYPHATIYVYNGKVPGWKIVAVDVHKTAVEIQREREQTNGE